MFFYEKHWFGSGESFDAYTMSDTSFPFHFHRSFELMCVTEGTLTAQVGKGEYILREGDVCLVFPNQLHAFSSDRHFELTVAIFSPELVQSFTLAHKGSIPVYPVAHMEPFRPQDLDLRNIYMKKSFLYRVCGTIEASTQFTQNLPGHDAMRLLHQLLMYIEDHLDSSCTLFDTASDLGYDYSYISRLFSEKMGMPFTSYVNQCRVIAACGKLVQTDENVQSIAQSCGYENVRTFNRNFKKVTGMSPVEYRASRRDRTEKAG